MMFFMFFAVFNYIQLRHAVKSLEQTNCELHTQILKPVRGWTQPCDPDLVQAGRNTFKRLERP